MKTYSGMNVSFIFSKTIKSPQKVCSALKFPKVLAFTYYNLDYLIFKAKHAMNADFGTNCSIIRF